MTENGSPLDRAESRMQKADAAIDAKALGALAKDAGIGSLAFFDGVATQKDRLQLANAYGMIRGLTADLDDRIHDRQRLTAEQVVADDAKALADVANLITHRDFFVAMKPHVAALHAIIQQIERKDD